MAKLTHICNPITPETPQKNTKKQHTTDTKTTQSTRKPTNQSINVKSTKLSAKRPCFIVDCYKENIATNGLNVIKSNKKVISEVF